MTSTDLDELRTMPVHAVINGGTFVARLTYDHTDSWTDGRRVDLYQTGNNLQRIGSAQRDEPDGPYTVYSADSDDEHPGAVTVEDAITALIAPVDMA